MTERETNYEVVNSFVDEFDKVQGEIHDMAVEKGWWDGSVEPNVLEKLMLVVSEAGEATEALRHPNPDLRSDKIPDFLAVEEEIADMIIRLMDMSGFFGWRLGEAIVAKVAYNAGRSYRHGGKRC